MTSTSLFATTIELKSAAMNSLFTKGLRSEPLKETAIGAMPETLGRHGRSGSCAKS